MDNASIHHMERVVTTMQNTGALVRFLPLYCPDFNPIEELFSKFKAYLKANEVAYDATTTPSLLITMAFCTVTIEDSIGYITHAGYNI